MKKILLFIVMAMFVGCAPTPEKMARALIKDYIEKNLDDPSTYEAVEFGELDSIIYPWAEYAASLQNGIDRYTAEIEDCKKSIAKYKSMPFDMSQFIPRYQKLIDEYQSVINDYNEKLEKEDEWVEFEGFKITHTFRATNAFGAKILNKYIFTISPDLTTIEDVEIIEE